MSTDSGPIAVVAAFSDEVGGVVARLDGHRKERVAGVTLHRGTLSGREVVVAAAGEGAQLARAGLRLLLDQLPIRAVLGVGVAGALTGDLEPGGRGDSVGQYEIDPGRHPADDGIRMRPRYVQHIPGASELAEVLHRRSQDRTVRVA